MLTDRNKYKNNSQVITVSEYQCSNISNDYIPFSQLLWTNNNKTQKLTFNNDNNQAFFHYEGVSDVEKYKNELKIDFEKSNKNFQLTSGVFGIESSLLDLKLKNKI